MFVRTSSTPSKPPSNPGSTNWSEFGSWTLGLAVIALPLLNGCDKRDDRRSQDNVTARPVVDSNPFVDTREDPRSTFSIDVDTASYSRVRQSLMVERQLPQPSSVRTEELINYFDYAYPQPTGPTPFSLTTEVGPCPWNDEHRLVHIGVQGKRFESEQTPARNLVFLIDTSGSMAGPDKLGLIETGLAALTETLGPDDRVAIVSYAGSAGLVLPPTSGADKQTILDAMDRLRSGGSTNGGAGIELAYTLAEQSFVVGGVNRVVLATDGDFNVGTTSHIALVEMIEAKRESGVYLSVLGVGAGNLDDHTMEQLADHGNGNYAYLDGEFEARKVLVAEAGATLVTIAKDVKIQVEFDPEQVAEHRLIGYENRVLAHHEFDDDDTDAGEIGAGHSVTAIYEITPTNPSHPSEVSEREGEGELGARGPLLRLDLRYEQPEGDGPSEEISVSVSVMVRDAGQSLAASSDDFRFAAAVAAFGERLRGQSGPEYAEILTLAAGGLGPDSNHVRRQFLDLVTIAAQLSTKQSPPACTTNSSGPRRTQTNCANSAIEPASQDNPPPATEHFWRDVLLLLPAFLGLPMFVAAYSRRRKA